MKVVSSCLAGCKCRYDARSCWDEKFEELVQKGEAIGVCPEQLGGLSTPRLPAEIIGGDGYDVLDGTAKVMDQEGNDVTQAFVKGAYEALAMAKQAGVTEAVLKEHSPSCGSSFIYDGSFQGVKIAGVGVTAALFQRNGIKVKSEKAAQ